MRSLFQSAPSIYFRRPDALMPLMLMIFARDDAIRSPAAMNTGPKLLVDEFIDGHYLYYSFLTIYTFLEIYNDI